MTQTYKVQVSMNQAHIVESGFVWKQGDFGFNIEIEVLDFDTTGATPQIIFRKSTGAVEATQISVAGNKFTYAIRGTELDTPGPCVCDLKLKDSTTKRVSTASFKYFVIPDTMDGLNQQASSYSDTIAQIVGGFDEEIDYLNTTTKEIALTSTPWVEVEGITSNGVVNFDTGIAFASGKHLTISNASALVGELIKIRGKAASVSSSYNYGLYALYNSNDEVIATFGESQTAYDAVMLVVPSGVAKIIVNTYDATNYPATIWNVPDSAAENKELLDSLNETVTDLSGSVTEIITDVESITNKADTVTGDVDLYENSVGLGKVYSGVMPSNVNNYKIDIQYNGNSNEQFDIEFKNMPNNINKAIIYAMHSDNTYDTLYQGTTTGEKIRVTAPNNFITFRFYWLCSSYPLEDTRLFVFFSPVKTNELVNDELRNIKAFTNFSLNANFSYLDGFYIATNGTTIGAASGYSITSDYIDIGKYNNFYVYGNLGELGAGYYNIWGYDSAKSNPVGLYRTNSNRELVYEKITIPNNIKYIRLCIRTPYKFEFSIIPPVNIDKVNEIAQQDLPIEDAYFILPNEVYLTSKPLFSHKNGITNRINTEASVYWVTGATEWGGRSKPLEMLDWSEIPNNQNAYVTVSDNLLVKYQKTIAVHKKTTNPTDAPLKLMCIGDSITNRGLANSIDNYLHAVYGMTASNVICVGTMTNNFSKKGEGREGWKYINFIGKSWTSQIGESISPQTTKADGDTKKNPFVRVATAGDDPEKVFDYNGTGYIFDFGNYLTVQEVSTPDIIVLALSTNDILSGASTYKEDCKEAMDIMLDSIIEAAPSAKICVIPTWGFGMTDAGNSNMKKAWEWSKECIADIKANYDSNVKAIMATLFTDRSTAYNSTETALTSDINNMNIATISDSTHNKIINQFADVITRWIVNMIP